MPSLDERLKLLRDVGGPDLWEEIQRREPRRSVPGPSPRSRWAAGAVALAVAIAGLSLTIWVFQAGQPRPAAPISNGRIAFSGFDGTSWDIYSVEPDGSGLKELTHLSNRVAEDPAWSPDGRRIAYVVVENAGGGRSDVWVMNGDGSNPTRLTEGPGASLSPTWSPNGSRIAYTHSAPGQADQVWIMDANGSNARAFTYCDPPECLRDGSPAWSPDGERIAFVRVSGAGAIVPVSVMVWPIDRSGSKPEDVSLEGATWASDLAWSPDGSELAFARSTSDGASFGLWVMDADGSKQRSLTEVASAQSPAWSPDSRQMAFAGLRPGTDHDTLLVMDAEGGGAQEIRGLPVEALSPSWQPVLEEPTPTPPQPGPKANGAIVFQGQDGAVYEVGSDGRGLRELFPASRGITQIAWSPDGNRIAWAGAVDGRYGIHVSALDGSDARQLTDGANDGWPAWSPDGTRIAFSRSSEANASRCSRDAEWNLICRTDLFVMRADGSDLTRITSDPAPEYDPEWSPDGTRIAYTKSDLFGTAIWVAKGDGSDPRQVSSARGGSDFRESWSPDGSEIAFSAIRYEDTYIWLVNADGTNERVLMDAGFATGPAWSPDGSRIAFVGLTSDLAGTAQSEATLAVFVMRSDGSSITEIAEVPGGVAGDIAWQPLVVTDGSPSASPSASEATPTPSISSTPVVPQVTATISAGAFLRGVAVGEGAVWASVDNANSGPDDHLLVRIDPTTNKIVDSIPLPEAGDLALGEGSVWVLSHVVSGGAILRINPSTSEIAATIPVGDQLSNIAVGEGAVWVTRTTDGGTPSGEVVRIDPTTNEIVNRIPISGGWPRDLVIGDGWVWAYGHSRLAEHGWKASSLWRIDPISNEAFVVVDQDGFLGDGSALPDNVAVGDGYVWAAAADKRGTGLRIDAASGEVARFEVEGGFGWPFLVKAHRVWFGRDRIRLLDTETLEVVGVVDAEIENIDAAFDSSTASLWVANYDGTITRIDLV